MSEDNPAAKTRILCVDDDVDLLESVRLHLLANESLELTCYDDPLKALEELKKGGPEYALALVDIKMPGMSGIEFLAQVHDLSPRTVRVNMSSHADLDLVLEALGSNHIYDFIRKPIMQQEFMAAVLKASKYYQLRKERDDLAEMLKEKNAQLEKWNQRLDEEVRRKTQELDLRDRLMQHLSGCQLLEDPYGAVREFLEMSLEGVGHLVLAKDKEAWVCKDRTGAFSVLDPSSVQGGAEVNEQCGRLVASSLKAWESALSLPPNFIVHGEPLQYRDGCVGIWLFTGRPFKEAEAQAVGRFAALVGLLIYDELTLDRIGELSEGLLS